MIDFKRLFKSFIRAFSGLGYAIKNENTIRTGVIISIIVLFFSFYCPLNSIERSIVILCIVIVMGAEFINTQIERINDLLDDTYNYKIKIIKDISAGGVLLCILGAGIIGFLIFWPHLTNL